MQNLLDLPIPSDPIAKIWHFVRDVAYGTVLGYWQPFMFLMPGEELNFVVFNEEAEAAFFRKWENQHRLMHTLQVACTLGYLTNEMDRYELTAKAIALLERPAALPSVFIAYGTDESSAFGLAIEYRLSAFGIPVFIDRSIPPGEDWDHLLEERIRNSAFVVCLLHPNTINRSDYVCKEIRLAHATGSTFVSIQHSGFDASQHVQNPRVPDIDLIQHIISERQSIIVRTETAKAYHDAVEELLNRLGITLQRGAGPDGTPNPGASA